MRSAALDISDVLLSSHYNITNIAYDQYTNNYSQTHIETIFFHTSTFCFLLIYLRTGRNNDSRHEASSFLSEGNLTTITAKISDPLPHVISMSKTAGINNKSMLAILMQHHFNGLLLTREGRLKALQIQFEAVNVLLACHPDQNALMHFFQDKARMLQVSTGTS